MSNHCDDLKEVIFVALAVGFIAFAFAAGCHSVEQTKREAIKAGLVETTDGRWVKPENLEKDK